MESGNIVHSEIPFSIIASIFSCFTIIMYLAFVTRLQAAYYKISRKRHRTIKKSYSVTWRILNAFAFALLIPCILGVAYILGGLALGNSNVLYNVGKDVFRFYIMLPVIIFWSFVALASCTITFTMWAVKSESDAKIPDKVAEFERSIKPLSFVTEETFDPGQTCTNPGIYKAVDDATQGWRGEVAMNHGDQFPAMPAKVYYVKIEKE